MVVSRLAFQDLRKIKGKRALHPEFLFNNLPVGSDQLVNVTGILMSSCVHLPIYAHVSLALDITVPFLHVPWYGGLRNG